MVFLEGGAGSQVAEGDGMWVDRDDLVRAAVRDGELAGAGAQEHGHIAGGQGVRSRRSGSGGGARSSVAVCEAARGNMCLKVFQKTIHPLTVKVELIRSGLRLGLDVWIEKGGH